MLLKLVERKIFEGILEIKTNGIERIHCLGRQKQIDASRARPRILKLLNYQDKVTIIKHCAMLKGKGFSVSEYFFCNIHGIRKKLWNRTKDIRDKQVRVILTYNKVRLNWCLFLLGAVTMKSPKNEEQAMLRKTTHSKSAEVTLLNVNAHVLQIDHFEALLLDLIRDIVAVTETWFYPDILDLATGL